MPETGGEVIYLEAAYSSTVSLMFTWTSFFVLKAGSHAILGLIFARYIVGAFSPVLDDSVLVKVVAVASIILLNAVNAVGTSWATKLQNVGGVAKFLTIAFVVLSAFIVSLTGSDAVTQEPAFGFNGSNPWTFGSACIGCMWAYDGWNNVMQGLS
jgi:amino acid transporter